MSDLPAPLTPQDCDLTSLDWFPLYFHKLLQSRFWLSASDKARSCSVDLWCESYRQVPAGSLPNDEIVLAKLAGFGRMIEEWRRYSGEILAPWVLCSDNRWYHPMVCETALEAFHRRLKERARKPGKAGEIADKRKAEIEAMIARLKHSKENGSYSAEYAPASAEIDANSAENGVASTVTRQDMTGHDLTGEDPPLPPVGDGDDDGDDLLGKISPPSPDVNQLARDAFEAFKAMADQYGIPIPEKLTEPRRKAIKARIRDHGAGSIQRMLDAYNQSAFLRGEEGNENWRGAVFDWAFRPTNFQKIIEGNYVDKPGRSGANGRRNSRSGASRSSIYDEF